MYFSLNPEKIVKTTEKLLTRIEEKFPNRGIQKLCNSLLEIAFKSRDRSEWIGKPLIPIRFGISILIIVVMLGIIKVCLILNVKLMAFELAEFIQTFDAFINVLIFVGLFLLFLITIETRIKRRRALKAIHELRALAHVIDMHQLTKDPEVILIKNKMDSDMQHEAMTPFELMRYLDFCCDMLSIIGKVAALYVQDFDDPILLSSVNEIQSLTMGLSSNIGQKIQTVQMYEKSNFNL